MTTAKTIALTIWSFVGKRISLLLNMLSRFVVAFLPSGKHLLISCSNHCSQWIWNPRNKVCHCLHVSPSICHEVKRLNAMILAFWRLSFKPTSSLTSFTWIKRHFSSSSLSLMKVVFSAYLRLLIFLLAILIPTCASSSPAFLMMYSAYKLNKQGDNTGRMPFVNEGRDLSHTAARQGTPVGQQTPRC